MGSSQEGVSFRFEKLWLVSLPQHPLSRVHICRHQNRRFTCRRGKNKASQGTRKVGISREHATKQGTGHFLLHVLEGAAARLRRSVILCLPALRLQGTNDERKGLASAGLCKDAREKCSCTSDGNDTRTSTAPLLSQRAYTCLRYQRTNVAQLP